MVTSFPKQKRTQIILAAIILLTLPCYGLGFLFVSLNRRGEPTPGPLVTETATLALAPALTDTSTPIIPTRFPTFTPTLTATITETPSPTATDTSTPLPTDTFTVTPSNTASLTPSVTPSPTTEIPPTTEPPPESPTPE